MKSTSFVWRSVPLFLFLIIFACQSEPLISFEKEKNLSDSFMLNYETDNVQALTDSANLVLDSLILKLSQFRPASNKYWLQSILVKANDLSNKSEYKNSNTFAFKALNLIQKEPNGNAPSILFLADLHSLIGYNWEKLAHYERSINHSEKARLLYQEIDKQQNVASEYGNQALSYIAFGNIEAANITVEKSRNALEKITANPYVQMLQSRNQYVQAMTYHQLAQYANIQGQTEKMIANCNQAIQLFYKTVNQLKNQPDYAPQLHATYSSIATNYSLLAPVNDIYADSALIYLRKTIPYYKNNPTKIRSEYLGYLYGLESLNLATKKKFKKASISLEKALSHIGYYSSKKEFPRDTLFRQHPHRMILLSILSFQGRNYFEWYKNNFDLKYLLKSKDTFEESIAITEDFALDFSSEKSLIQYRARLEEIFSNYIKVLIKLYELTEDIQYFEAAFTISERHKNFILRQGLNRQISSYPIGDQRQVIIEKEKHFEKQRRLISQKRSTQPKDISPLLDASLALQKKEATFSNGLKNSTNPIESNYFQDRYDQSIPDLKTIRQDFLDDKTALIEYNFSSKKPVAFVITSTSQYHISLEIDDQFYEILRELLQENLYYENLARFKQNAHKIYQTIFKEIHAQLPETIDQLIIVPDNHLRALPFEALLSSVPKEETPIEDYPFLLNKYAIGYIYSVATYHLAEKRLESSTRDISFDFVGFNASPEKIGNDAYFEGCNPSSLPNLAKATSSIAQLFNSKQQRIFAKAKKKDFIEYAPQSDIVHLAMHGCVGQRAPLDYGLQFVENTDPILTVNELLDLSLQARLVVLGSCDTESGQLNKGEGIASIARAFRQVGCLNMIASLQTVNDKFGAEIYKSFYHHWIIQEENSVVALAKAKRDFLQNSAFTNRDKNPIKWAGIITIGKAIDWKE